ncbi:MAG TPA: hypothetical protein VN663_16160 [Ramlibacter sp.]|nr:hypothetical protein [Ramlibacter sp.]
MSFLRKIFGLQPVKAASSRAHSQLSPPTTSLQSKSSPASPISHRRELLGVVLRDTLARQGIPAAWLSPEMLLSTSRSREPGLHLRLIIKHWDSRLLVHAVALQNALIIRLLASDPLASDWLMGISWQFALPDEGACPPMPHPGSWTANPEATQRAPEVERSEDSQSSADVRSDLERLFAARDAELEMNAQRLGGTDATQPMFLKTQPMEVDDLPSPERDPPNLRF